MLLLSLVAVLVVGVGGTLAYIITQTELVQNIFNPTRVTCEVYEEFKDSKTLKENVAIDNTGTIPAYIRAEVVVTWQNENGEVYGQKPIAGTDYSIIETTDTPNSKWFSMGDYYYWSDIVPVEDKETTDLYEGRTGVLIESIEPIAGTEPEGYTLCVEILASAIQADGGSKIGEPAVWTPAVTQAWGVKVVDGKLSVE